RWWIKAILPGIFPYYITGAITASGGSWNASIVAEVASWGDTHLMAKGLGAYIATATEAGGFPRVVLGIVVMCVLVTLFNRLLWRPLYAFGERRLRLGWPGEIHAPSNHPETPARYPQRPPGVSQ